LVDLDCIEFGPLALVAIEAYLAFLECAMLEHEFGGECVQRLQVRRLHVVPWNLGLLVELEMEPEAHSFDAQSLPDAGVQLGQLHFADHVVAPDGVFGASGVVGVCDLDKHFLVLHVHDHSLVREYVDKPEHETHLGFCRFRLE